MMSLFSLICMARLIVMEPKLIIVRSCRQVFQWLLSAELGAERHYACNCKKGWNQTPSAVDSKKTM